MFSNNQSLPPPPSSAKPRNESLGATLPTYRNRPKGGSSVSSALSMFETLNKPENRNQVVGLAKNPLVQKAVAAGAKNEAVRSAAFSYAKDAVTKPQPKERTTAGSAVLGMAKQFENKPIMGQTALESNFGRSQNSDFSFSEPNGNTHRSCINKALSLDSFSFSSTTPSTKSVTHNAYSYSASTPAKNSMYPSLSAQDPFEYPPQLPSSNASASWTMPTENKFTPSYSTYSTSLIDIDFNKSQKAPPARPPPPKIGSRSNPNLAALCPSPEPATNEPHAIVKYPYNAAGNDELTCKPNDLVLLKREVDGQWIYALNTRTGASGIVPMSFLQVKVPLVPTFGQTLPSSYSDYGLGRNVARALYDYDTGVVGDLKFNQGDMITITERVNNEWLRGEVRGRVGIFPVNYVQFDVGSSTVPQPAPQRTAVALYDYNSGVADDLVFKCGDVITITEEVSSEWLRGQLQGRSGLVPITYVKY